MYDQIAANKRKTWLLMFVVSAILIGLVTLLGYAYGLDIPSSLVVGAVLATCFSLVSYYMSDRVALATSGAVAITRQQAPDLWNVVENLTIANGMPMPSVYVIEDSAMNAFATGRDPAHASITFTTGLLAALTRTELEGVAAHELSHIKNYDIRTMTIVVILIGAIMLLADVLLRSMLFRGGRRERENDGGVGVVLMLAGVVLAILSPLFAELIKLAVSRTREYLADASGALLTRHPDGLASALAKISTSAPLRSANHATAHLFIANPFNDTERDTVSLWERLFSTHPPVADRIARLRAMGK